MYKRVSAILTKKHIFSLHTPTLKVFILKDWIPQDLPGVRVLCVEYDTELSEWMAMCPHETERRTISFRSRTLLDKIKHAGVGDRLEIFLLKQLLLLFLQIVCQSIIYSI